MAGGGHETDRHYQDTIKNRRPVDEFSKYLASEEEVTRLKEYAHDRPYAVWGAVPGSNNISHSELASYRISTCKYSSRDKDK